MKGYIAVTSNEWFDFLSLENPSGEINFWRKNTNNFRVLEQGEPFFFLVKNQKGVIKERLILGMAIFKRYEINTIDNAWNKYHRGNGDETKEKFMNRLLEVIKIDGEINQVGCIILSDFKVFNNPVALSELGIDFQNSVVSGKSIVEKDIRSIQIQGLRRFSNVVMELNEYYNVGFTEDDAGFPEGKLILKQHLVRERNSAVIKIAKQRFKERYGKLTCEVCEFDFNKHYGKIGEDYIEGHHTKPVSEMIDNEETKVEDIALVCANCHRMLHRKRPWLAVNELKELLK